MPTQTQQINSTLLSWQFSLFLPPNWHAELRSLLLKEKGNYDRPFSECRNNINKMRFQITTVCRGRSCTTMGGAFEKQSSPRSPQPTAQWQLPAWLVEPKQVVYCLPPTPPGSLCLLKGEPVAVQTPVQEQPGASRPGPSLCTNSRQGPDSRPCQEEARRQLTAECTPDAGGHWFSAEQCTEEGQADEISSLLWPHAQPEDAAGLAASPTGPQLTSPSFRSAPALELPSAAKVAKAYGKGSCSTEREQGEGLTPGPVSPQDNVSQKR